MHSNSLGCPKIFSPSAPVLYWLSHLSCISSLKAKNDRKTLIYTQQKISRYNQHFSLFLDQFLSNDLRPINFTVIWAQMYTLHWQKTSGLTHTRWVFEVLPRGSLCKYSVCQISRCSGKKGLLLNSKYSLSLSDSIGIWILYFDLFTRWTSQDKVVHGYFKRMQSEEKSWRQKT